MSAARRALVVLVSVVAVVAGFTPAAFAHGVTAAVVKRAAPAPTRSAARPHVEPAAVNSQSLGYWLVASDGGIFSGGDAAFHGSTGAIHLARPIVGLAPTPSGHGYWLVASDGGIFAFGDAAFYGSTGAMHLARPIAGVASTPSGHGYWLVASDGGIFAFGDAKFYGSTGAMHLNRPIVGVASTPSGHGYWMVASDGGIFAFGDAKFYGSTGAIHLNKAIVGIASSLSGHGYRMVASDGGVFTFGDAEFNGSTGGITLNQPIVGMAATASGKGYWFVAADGGVFSFGDAGFFGSAGALGLNQNIVGMVATIPVPVQVAPTATKLAFTTQPGDSTGGSALATEPVVAIQDATGHTVTDDTSAVTLALTTPNGATLDCAANPQTAVAGVASFSGCTVDHIGTYTLTATASGLTVAHSTTFDVTAGVGASLMFSTQPSGAVQSVALGTQPAVSVLDAGGNLATGATSSVTLALTVPGGATLACTANPKAAVAGVATFAGCNVSTSGSYSLTATDGSLTSAVSSSIEITGVATKLAFTTQPSATATGGLAFATQPVVTVQDSVGRTIIANTSSVTLALTVAGGATFVCTANPKAAVAGVATFAGCNINLSGTYTLTASDGALATAASSSVVVGAGVAAKLAFTTQPVGATGATVFATQPVVTIQDAGGNTVTSDTSSVTLAITTPGGATLACAANPKAAVAGVATFTTCNIDRANTYTLTATDGALTPAVSSSFTITVGAAAKLAFTTQPSGAVGGLAFTTQPVVTVQDAGGNTVSGNTSSVTLALTTPAGATFTCNANPQGAVAGVATFAGCKIDIVGTYTLTATDGALTTAVSSSLPVVVGAAAKVVFSTQPSGGVGGTAFTTQPVVTVQDAVGNTVTTNVSAVTLTITTPAGATLGCTANPKTAVAGVAAFAGCNIDAAGTYTLTATDGALTTAVSSSISITLGPAAKLAFTTEPSGSTGGTAFGVQPVVTIQDAGGNTVTGNVTAVTLAITTPAGAVLACTANPKTAVAGVATFAGCTIDLAGTYTLTAADAALTPATSTSLTITVGVAAKLAFTTQPSGAVAAAAFATQPVVKVQDLGGNTVTTNVSSVTLALTTPGGATLLCTLNPKAAVAGVVTFAGCNIDVANTYTLTATDGSLTAAVSSSLTITVGAAAKLAFTTQPSASTGGLPFATQPVVTVQDAAGNTVVGNTSSVTLVLTVPGAASLTCTANPKAAVAGVATFAGCRIDVVGSYTLTASDGALTGAASNSIAVTVGVAAKLAYTTQPSASTGGLAFATQPVVAVQDAGGNTLTADTSAVTLALTTPAGATLACTVNPKNAVASVATFAGCNIDLVGTYTLTASDGALATAVSTSVVITVGTAAKVGFTTQPSGAVGGVAFATQPVVKVQDLGGNTVTTNASAVTLTITTPAGATLACTNNPQGAVAGVVSFAGCNIDRVGTYTLTATDGALATATSSSLTITVGAAAKVVFTTQPGGSSGGIAFGVQPVVAVQDAVGNTVTTNTSNVTLTIATPAGATLTCTANPKAAVAGVAVFAACAIDHNGTFTLTASDGALTTAVSGNVVITVGAAAKLAYTTQPGGSTGGIAFAVQPVVTVQDLGGNTVTSNTSAVTLTLTVAGSATLTCTTNPQAAVAGVGTFAGCKIDVAGTYTLTAADGSLTTAVSGNVVITVGAAAKLGYTTQPVGSTGGLPFAAQPVVAVQDLGGNTVTTNASSIALTITAPAGGATLTCTNNSVTASSGVATFAACRIDLESTHTLTATGAGFTVVSSNVVTTVGAAAKLVYLIQPTGAQAGSQFGTQPAVRITDAGGNTVTTDVSNVLLAVKVPGAEVFTCTLNPKQASSGVAFFAGCTINLAGSYILTATDGSLTPADSATVVMTP